MTGQGERVRTDGTAWRHVRWSLVLGMIFFPAPVFALLLSMSFESVPGSVPLTGSGSNAASLNLGTVSAFEPLITGVNRTVNASSYNISTRFGVRASHLLNLTSPSYTLQARLRTANPLTWRLNGVTMSTTPTTVSSSQPYGAIVPHTLSFVVPFSHPAGTVTTVLEVTAIAN